MEKMAIDSPMDTSVALAPAAPPSRLPVTIPVTSGNESDSSHGGGSGSMTRPLAFRQRAPLILTTQASDDDFDDLETRSNISTSTLGDASDRSSGGRIGRGLLLRRNGSETPSIRLPNLSQLSSSMPSLSTASRDDITSSNSGLNDNDTAAAGPPLRKLSIGISDSNMAGVKQGGNGRPLRPTPSLSQLSTGGGMSKRPRNAKNLSLMVPMNRSYHSAPNSPPGTPGGSHPGLLSMMMARRDETMPEDEQERGPLTGVLNHAAHLALIVVTALIAIHLCDHIQHLLKNIVNSH
ncbi:hypothetical protein BDF19DRAFT_291783 [Syncephalis fuscata]|nr:hypothetical protein BDF19DRAFT_291783 [Syncephalis fuscata]